MPKIIYFVLSFDFSDSEISYCGRYLIISVQKSTKNNLVYVCDLSKTGGKFTGKLDLMPIVTEFEADYEVILFLRFLIFVRIYLVIIISNFITFFVLFF